MNDSDNDELKKELEGIKDRERTRFERNTEWAIRIVLIAAVLPWSIWVTIEIFEGQAFRRGGPRFTEVHAENLLNTWEDRVVTRMGVELSKFAPKYLADKVDENSDMLDRIEGAVHRIDKAVVEIQTSIKKSQP